MARAVALLLLVQGALSLQLMAPSRRMAPVAPMVARFAPVSMQQDGAREREKKTGRQATIARPKPKPVQKSKEEVDKEGEWKVLLHNDDVSLALTRSALLPACANSTNSQGTASRALRRRAGAQVHTFDYVNMAICQTVAGRAKTCPIHHWALPRPCTLLRGLAVLPPTRPRATADTQTQTQTHTHTHTHTRTQRERERETSHLLSPGLDAIQVATVTRAKAHRITVAAHTNNLAVVTTTWKQMAKQYCIKLQKFGLTSSIAPGDGGGDDGGDGPETQ